MSYFSREKDKITNIGEGCLLLDSSNGCVKGCCAGTAFYSLTEYSTPGVHEDQEGFYVLEGTGWAKVGNEEFRIEHGTSFMAPAGTPHTMKRDSDSVPIKVFWFHSAI